jgi:hypothetical protein
MPMKEEARLIHICTEAADAAFAISSIKSR